jgi:carbon storage regulator CsrA
MEEGVWIGPDVYVKLLSFRNGKVRLAIVAPTTTKILREELLEEDDPRKFAYMRDCEDGCGPR